VIAIRPHGDNTSRTIVNCTPNNVHLRPSPPRPFSISSNTRRTSIRRSPVRPDFSLSDLRHVPDRSRGSEMFDDWAKRNFQEREARLGDKIARRAARMPWPRKADSSVAPSTGPTFAEAVARAMNCPGPASDTRRPVSAAGAATFHLKVTSVGRAGAAQEPDGPGPSRRRAALHQLYIERDAAVERLSPPIPRIAELSQQQAYIERPQAVEQAVDAASFGNCGRTAEQRAAFWAAVEECGHPARSFVVATCYRNRSPAFWRAVSDDPTAPACLKALEGPGPHKLKFKTEAEAAPVMAFADTHGEIGPDAKFERAIVFSPGRASRIQTRLIIELPCELTPKQRLRLAKRICRALFGPQIRYWAAIHAPDAHNDSRNFHLHVVFSDLPTRKIRDNSGQRVWDFTILELREDKENRNKRWHRPYRQLRDRTFSARNWIKQTRERVAELVNDALAEAGVERRVDPRSYSEMGIDREPEPRAPGWAYSLEKRGVETAAARPAIEAQWQRARQRLSQQYDDFQPDARMAARFGAAFRRVSDRIDTTLRLEALTAGEQWRSAVMRQNAAEADAAALRFNMAKIHSRLAPPIETGDGRNRDADLAQLATIEAELLAEIRQQAAAAAAAEARALETLAKFEKELGVGGEQVRLGDGTEGQSPQTVSAPAITIYGLVDSAMRPSSAHGIADDELWTLHDQCAALRARTLALASSSALAYANLNDTVAAAERRAAQAPASPSQYDDRELADHGGLPLPIAGTAPQSRSAPDAADHRQLDQRRTQEALTSGDMSVALAARALALSAASATADSELASAPIALTRQRHEAVVESELPPVDPAHIAVDAPERQHALKIVAASGSADLSAQHERRHHEFQRQSDIVAVDQYCTVAANSLALLASGAALAAKLIERETSQSRRQHAAAAEATAVDRAHLQIDAISAMLAPIPPLFSDQSEERRHRQQRRDRQREQDRVAADEDLADRTRALVLSSSASLAELEIIADETSLNLARRAVAAAERAIGMQYAQFDETTDVAADAANAADPVSAPIVEHADDQRSIESALGADRSADRRNDRSLSGATRDDAQVAEEPDGRARESTGPDEDAERATAARRDLGGTSNPAGGHPAPVLGQSRSGAGRSDAEAYREMRSMPEPGGGVRRVGASSDRQIDDPAVAGMSGGAQIPTGARRDDVQPVSANAGRADQSRGSANQPGSVANKLMAEYQLRLQRERDRLQTSASAKGIAPAAAKPESRAYPSVAASAMHAASKPISRPDVYTDSASSDAVDRDQAARLDSIRAEIAAGEQVARDIEKIRAGNVGPPPRPVEASPERTASNSISRLDVHTDSASSDAANRDQTARLDSIRADIAAVEQEAREIEKIRAGGASSPPRHAEADPKPAASTPISQTEVHSDNAASGAAADRNKTASVEPIRGEGKNSRAGSAPHHAEAVARPAPQAAASAEPPPSAKPDGDKLAPPTKEGPIIPIGGRALSNKVLRRKPPVWGR
jgi:hypothetical protein